MIRAARYQDIPAIGGLIRRQHAASRYAGRVAICDKALDAMLLGAVAAMGQQGPQGSHASVAERDGAIVGFLIGILSRTYEVGDKLTANDLFLVNEGDVGDLLALVDAYVAWATANRKVIEIKLSWSDTLPGASRVEGLFRRKGFHQCGAVWSVEPARECLEAAA